MKDLIPIDPSGRLVLPMPIRRRLNLEKGGVCRIHLVGGRLELEPVAQPGRRLRKVGRFLVAESTGRKAEAVRDIDDVRRDRS